MIQFIFPVIAAAYILKKTADYLLKDEDVLSQNHIELQSILRKNLAYLKMDLGKKADKNKIIAFIGQPGSGKSSLIRNVTKDQCKPLPAIGTKTDMTDWSGCLFPSYPAYIYFRDFIIVDSPGYNTVKHPSNIMLSSFPFNVFGHVVVVISGKLHESDLKIMKKLKDEKINYLLVRSFADQLENKGDRNNIKTDFRKNFGLTDKIHFVSNRTQEGVESIISKLSFNQLKEFEFEEYF